MNRDNASDGVIFQLRHVRGDALVRGIHGSSRRAPYKRVNLPSLSLQDFIVELHYWQ